MASSGVVSHLLRWFSMICIPILGWAFASSLNAQDLSQELGHPHARPGQVIASSTHPHPVSEPKAVVPPEPSRTLLARCNALLHALLFFDIANGSIVTDSIDTVTGSYRQHTVPIPFVIVVLVSGAVFFTLYYGWINIRGFRHAIRIVQGQYDDPHNTGEVSHQILREDPSFTAGMIGGSHEKLEVSKGNGS